MRTAARRPLFGVLALLMTAAAASAQPPAAPPTHVRGETADGRALVRELIDRSPTFRALIDRIEQSDVIVYIRHRAFTSVTLDGRIGVLASDGRQRFLMIELSCQRSRFVQMVTLGHEIRHAVEIVDAPEVVDARTLAQHYTRIGMHAGVVMHSDAYETNAAAETASVVRRELLAPSRPAAPATAPAAAAVAAGGEDDKR